VRRLGSPEDAASIVPLLGERVVVLHAPDAARQGMSGRDIDCAVQRLDPMWPLRVPAGWRLCQRIEYDVRASYSILERDDAVVHIDAIDDVDGIGRYGFPTALLEGHGGESPPAGVRATYLLLKRLLKDDRSPREWHRIGDVAARDPDGFLQTLAQLFGTRAADRIARSCAAGAAPDHITWRRMRRQQRARRLRSPSRAAAWSFLTVGRVARRISQPSGLSVLVVGPDGAGKSALADNVRELGEELFRRDLHWHWRPQLLPAPASLLGRAPNEASEPHGRQAHGPMVSLALVGYYWLDCMIGGWLRDRSMRIRSGLVVVERGWWDLLVDPRRYRIGGGSRLARCLSALVPRPDLVLLLEAPANVLLRRKDEISAEELDRQTAAWRTSLPRGVRMVRLDATQPLEHVQREARRQILDHLDDRAKSRVSAGWTSTRLPGSGRRILLPRGPRRASRSSIRVIHPGTRAEVAAWLATRLYASLWGLRLRGRSSAPPEIVRDALARHLPPRSTYAVALSEDGLSFFALIVDRDGRSLATAKIAVDERAARLLDQEAENIRRLGSLLRPPLFAPTILAQEHRVLLLEAASWRSRFRAGRLPDPLAHGLGAFFRAGSNGGRGPAHGRLTPRNILCLDEGWMLCEWSGGSMSLPPFFDVLKYFRHVRRPARRALHAYADGAGIPTDRVPGLVEDCLATLEQPFIGDGHLLRRQIPGVPGRE
jgi:hypothetical protein